jgi:hypothetical protein
VEANQTLLEQITVSTDLLVYDVLKELFAPPTGLEMPA